MKKKNNTQNKGKKLGLMDWIVRGMVGLVVLSLASIAFMGQYVAATEASKLSFYVYVQQMPDTLELNLSPIFNLDGRLPEDMQVALFLESDPAEQ